MELQSSPLKFGKLPIGSRVLDFQTHPKQPTLLVSTAQRNIESHFLQSLDQKRLQVKSLPMRVLNVQCVPDLMCFSGKNILHCEDSLLVINNKQQIRHKSKINHLLVDQSAIALTSCEDCVLISSTEKAQPLGELHYYGSSISSLFWHNSLVGSGDESGLVNLWDLNKQKIINSNLIHASPVEFINAFVDYIHTNIYYTFCRKERRMSFHDLRTQKPIKIISNLAHDIRDIKHNQTGKIFLMSNQSLHLIDLYRGFDVLGKFSQVQPSNLQRFGIQHPYSEPSDDRSLTQLMIWHKYVIAGCSNGCVQIYDTDTYQCAFAYGMCELSGVKRLRRVKDSLVCLDEKGLLTVAKLI